MVTCEVYYRPNFLHRLVLMWYFVFTALYIIVTSAHGSVGKSHCHICTSRLAKEERKWETKAAIKTIQTGSCLQYRVLLAGTIRGRETRAKIVTLVTKS